MNIKIDQRLIRELAKVKNFKEVMYDLSDCSSTAKSLKMSVLCNDYSMEEMDYDDIQGVANLIVKQLDKSICNLYDIEEQMQEEKNRFARLIYAFINNGDIDKAKSELEKVLDPNVQLNVNN